VLWWTDIPFIATVKEDTLFRVETIDWTGGQIKDDDNSDDIKFVDLSQVHYMSGPIRCEDSAGKPAMPGDLLCVEICEVCVARGSSLTKTLPAVQFCAFATSLQCTMVGRA